MDELDRLRKDDKFNAYYCAEKVNEMNSNSQKLIKYKSIKRRNKYWFIIKRDKFIIIFS